MNDNSYINWSSMSDKAIAEQLGAFIKHHRIVQNRTQDNLAATAGISRSTLSLLERGESVALSTLIQVLRTLNLLHVLDSFEIPNVISPLALVKAERSKRKRASRVQPPTTN